MIVGAWKQDDGVLSFEWILLVSLLTIGIVSGIAGARDAVIDEFGDVAHAMVALDQSFTIDFPLEVDVHPTDGGSLGFGSSTATSSSNSIFVDGFTFTDCSRTSSPVGQSETAADDVE